MKVMYVTADSFNQQISKELLQKRDFNKFKTDLLLKVEKNQSKLLETTIWEQNQKSEIKELRLNIEERARKEDMFDLQDRIKMLTPMRDFTELKWKMKEYKLEEDANQDKNNLIDQIKGMRTDMENFFTKEIAYEKFFMFEKMQN